MKTLISLLILFSSMSAVAAPIYFGEIDFERKYEEAPTLYAGDFRPDFGVDVGFDHILGLIRKRAYADLDRETRRRETRYLLLEPLQIEPYHQYQQQIGMRAKQSLFKFEVRARARARILALRASVNTQAYTRLESVSVTVETRGGQVRAELTDLPPSVLTLDKEGRLRADADLSTKVRRELRRITRIFSLQRVRLSLKGKDLETNWVLSGPDLADFLTLRGPERLLVYCQNLIGSPKLTPAE